MKKNELITINGQSLPVREYEGQRVVTIADVAKVHRVKRNNIQRNFVNNKKRFIKGKHYFYVVGKKAVENILVGSKNITQINVFTETGYLKLTKHLTDVLSEQIHDMLIDNYFKMREVISYIQPKPAGTPLAIDSRENLVLKVFPLMRDEIKKLLYYRLEKQLTQEETALVLGICVHSVEKLEGRLSAAGLYVPKIKSYHDKFNLRSYKTMARINQRLAKIDFFEV